MHELVTAFRSLRRNPALSALVAIVLALGIGVNAAMFGIADQLLFRPPAYLGSPNSVGRLYISERFQGTRSSSSSASFPLFAAIRTDTSTVAVVAAHTTSDLAVATGTETAHLPITGASADFWRFFEIRPILGRFFTADDDQLPVGTNVAVLGYPAWRSRFGSDSAVIGKSVRIGPAMYTIVGVAPPSFSGFEYSASFAYIPITSYGFNDVAPDFASRGQTTWLGIVARRRNGATGDAVNSDLTRAVIGEWGRRLSATQLRQVQPRAELGSAIFGRGPEAGAVPAIVAWLLALSVVVVLIACANTANILLARAAGRQRDFAVRAALGASIFRLGREVAAEALLLALLAGVVGLAMSYWTQRGLQALLLGSMTGAQVSTLDGRTTLWVFGVALIAGLITGSVPLRLAIGSHQAFVLRGGGRAATAGAAGPRNVLVVVQVALAVVLLTGAGLFLRSFWAAEHVQLGYEPDRVLLVDPDLEVPPLTPLGAERTAQAIVERARQIPGVVGVARATTVAFLRNSYDPLWVPGIDPLPHRGEYAINVVTSEYFATVGTRLVQGRNFSDADHAATPREVVISQSMARVLWPDRAPLGQCIRVWSDTMPCSAVVGVVEDVRRGEFGSDVRLQYYVPWSQYPHSEGILHLRIAGGVSVGAVAAALQPFVPPPGALRVIPMRDLVAEQVAPWRIGAIMFTVFGALAVVLVAAGLLGIIGYEVTQRRRELGIRMALGATPGRIARLVMRRSLGITAAGIASGSVLAFAGVARLESLLFRTSPHDITTMIGVPALLLCVATIGGALPTIRLIRTSIVAALMTAS